MIIFTILVYIDRIVVNDIVLRLETLIRDEDWTNKYGWLFDFIEVHIILYTVTDFLGGCI